MSRKLSAGEVRVALDRAADALLAKARRATKAKNARKWRRHAAQIRRHQ